MLVVTIGSWSVAYRPFFLTGMVVLLDANLLAVTGELVDTRVLESRQEKKLIIFFMFDSQA